MSEQKKEEINPNVKMILDKLTDMDKQIQSLKETHSHEQPEKQPPPKTEETPPATKTSGALVPHDWKPSDIEHLKACPECRKSLDAAMETVYGIKPDMECSNCGEKVFEKQEKCLKCGSTKAR